MYGYSRNSYFSPLKECLDGRDNVGHLLMKNRVLGSNMSIVKETMLTLTLGDVQTSSRISVTPTQDVCLTTKYPSRSNTDLENSDRSSNLVGYFLSVLNSVSIFGPTLPRISNFSELYFPDVSRDWSCETCPRNAVSFVTIPIARSIIVIMTSFLLYHPSPYLLGFWPNVMHLNIISLHLSPASTKERLFY